MSKINELLNNVASLDENKIQNDILRINHSEFILKELENFWINDKYCDVILISGIDGKRISANRMILSASSTYFGTMFTNSIDEPAEKEVTIKDVTGDALHSLVGFCYSEMINLSVDIVQDVMIGAIILQMDEAIPICENYVKSLLNPSNCLRFFFFAQNLNFISLLNEAKTFISNHFLEICHEPEFFKLTPNQLEELLTRNDLNITAEEEVFHSLESWMQHDLANRQQYIPKLLPMIRLPLLSPSFLEQHVRNFHNSADCKNLVIEALKWHLLPQQRHLIEGTRTVPRKATVSDTLTVSYLEQGILKVQSYDPVVEVWKDWETPEMKMEYYKVVKYGNKLIFVGNSCTIASEVQIFSLDIQLKTWTHHSCPDEKSNFGIGILNDMLYIVGGQIIDTDKSIHLEYVTRYNLAREAFEDMTTMKVARSKPCVAVLKGYLYVIGGYENGNPLLSMESFDPQTETWSVKASLEKVRQVVCVASSNRYLYAIGKHGDRTNSIERYDSFENIWNTIYSIDYDIYDLDWTFHNYRLMAVGRLIEDSPFRTIFEHKLDTKDWKEVSQFPAKDTKRVRVFSNYPANGQA